MATVADLITYVRSGLGPAADARWSDADVLLQLNVGAKRAAGVLLRNGAAFARAKLDFNTTAGQQAYDIPGDFAAVVGLWRTDTHQQLTHRTQEQWEGISSASECTNFVVDGEALLIAGTPSKATPMRLRYWPTAPVLTLAGTSPWGGRLDCALGDYARARLFNTDEMDVSQDVQLLQDLENNVLALFAGSEPSVVRSRGWLA